MLAAHVVSNAASPKSLARDEAGHTLVLMSTAAWVVKQERKKLQSHNKISENIFEMIAFPYLRKCGARVNDIVVFRDL